MGGNYYKHKKYTEYIEEIIFSGHCDKHKNM